MKRSIYTFLLLMMSVFVYGQSYKGGYSVVSRELREESDTLYMSFDVHVHSSAVSQCGFLVMTPELEAGDSVQIFPHIILRGKDKVRQHSRWEVLYGGRHRLPDYFMSVGVNEDTDTVLHYSVRLPYEMWMDSARLILREQFVGCGNSWREQLYSLQGSVSLSPRTPYEVSPVLVYEEPAREEKRRVKQGQAYLDFQVGRSVIIPTFRRNPEELSRLRDAIDEVHRNPDIEIHGLYIEGYASPEGRYDSNEKLSMNRAYALKDYIRDHYGFAESRFTVSWVAEDWEGLKVLVNESDIRYKDEIVSVIDGNDIFDGRERKLMSLRGGVPYREMLRDMFPQLRRVEYQIDYSVKDYSLEESRALVGKSPDQLSQREMYLLAESYGVGSRDFEDLVELALRYYPDDPVARLNASSVMIGRGDLNTARRLLSGLNSGGALNNLGVISLLQGDLAEAEELLGRALSAGVSEASVNLEELTKKREDNAKMERYGK